ncbi:MAG: DUF1003 domain-containing protein [Crocinitomicaceae bacterium]|nr:DUF1003 domain-containing protein [Crocinitomicaceae bacterium]
MKNLISKISGVPFRKSEGILGALIRPSIFQLIVADHPEFTEDDYITFSELAIYREKYIADFLKKEIGELSLLEQKVVNTLMENSTISDKIEDSTRNETITFGQKLADKVASFGGSWTFIVSFGIFITIWILLNILILQSNNFDPYPFILLNLILSCIAALQAPVIMMSQNRQEEKDRERSKKDYMINLKSELEIQILHEKIDHLMLHQQQDLIELQKVQIEMINDVLKRFEKQQ